MQVVCRCFDVLVSPEDQLLSAKPEISGSSLQVSPPSRPGFRSRLPSKCSTLELSDGDGNPGGEIAQPVQHLGGLGGVQVPCPPPHNLPPLPMTSLPLNLPRQTCASRPNAGGCALLQQTDGVVLVGS